MPTSDQVTTLGPDGAPGVLLLHPWWGVTPAVRWWADELAGGGRRVVLPDLFGGATPATEEEAEALADATLADPATAALVARCADALAAEGAPWAAMGFSLGAFLACPLAGRGAAGPDELVLFYGGRPPAGADVRTRRVELHVAPGDPWFTDEELGEVSSGFRDVGAEVVVHRYEGCGHWFAEVGSPGHDAAATERARQRVLVQLGATAG
ncbi:dienelactone hydrolase family protein [Geodermatophilus sp. DF01_2]|uniref:dienelactone hydrolase family protein n=1 Tax=Geodermatophilus sp. DF01-2 TaxID=2559610 RepID=UPI00142FE794|nr:dienelactone hydrolase family protein [Geodermatophilus sp. DF01_2]